MGDALRPALKRRDFLARFGGAALASAGITASGANRFGTIAIVAEPSDSIAGSSPVRWACRQLQQALQQKGARATIESSPKRLKGATLVVLVAGQDSPSAKEFSKPVMSHDREAFSLTPGSLDGKQALLVSGSDIRGCVYGVLELADRVRYGAMPQDSLSLREATKEHAANNVRSIARAFCSEIEDKPWYYNKDFWRAYLTNLAAQRFNRFNLTFGLGYDFPRGVTGDYFHFLYPYLFQVPGYNVRVVPLPDSERSKNLEMLQFIAAETAGRGLHFQVGIWTHAYQWVDSPDAQHRIEGLTPETHAPYCRDALALLLKVCPQIEGLTLRVHGESGIPEGSYSFWQTVFEGIARAGRQIEIDMHAKGVDQKMIEIAVNTGMPVKLSPKFSGEHMGLGYQQAEIRELERPRPGSAEKGTFSLSNGSRRFLRYSYGDLLRYDRHYGILFRLWPGTQRVLLWGDPQTAAGYSRASHFCGAAGLDICEPLFFKGREGSGLLGGRCAYADKTLAPRYDFEKYAYTYRIWGRLLYNPDAEPESWRRYLRSEFGPAAGAMEASLAQASRILPIVTTTHLSSASNHSFWPEIDTNMPIVLGSEPSPYSDTPSPKCFGTVSPLDPQFFTTVNEHADDLLHGRMNPKYSPIEIAQWLEDCANTASESLAAARSRVKSSNKAGYRRAQEDIAIQAGLGRFFGAKMRSATFFEIYRQTGDRNAGEQAVAQYRKARDAWATMARRARTVYQSDITYGRTPIRRGDWTDRLAAIDTDLEAMEKALQEPREQVTQPVPGRPQRISISCKHAEPAFFRPGSPLPLVLVLTESGDVAGFRARLYYRHVNQAERWKSVDMAAQARQYQAAIPGEYTNSSFPLQYYFEIGREGEVPSLFPGFNVSWSNRPYYVVQRA